MNNVILNISCSVNVNLNSKATVKKNLSADAFVKARETAEEIRFKAMLKQRELPRIDAWIKTQNISQNKNAN